MWLIFGLRAPEFFQTKPHLHLPLIETKAVVFDLDLAIKQANRAETLLLTSQEGVRFFEKALLKIKPGKVVFCVGPNTEKACKELYQGEYLLPKTCDQEGLIQLIEEKKPGSIFYPKPKVTRPYLIQKLKEIGVVCQEKVIYETFSKVPDSWPDEKVTGYYFGSTSTVEAFKKLNRPLRPLPIYVSGQVTQKAVQDLLGSSAQVNRIF
jgi:uroporphyrinogen-III synthase